MWVNLFFWCVFKTSASGVYNVPLVIVEHHGGHVIQRGHDARKEGRGVATEGVIWLLSV